MSNLLEGTALDRELKNFLVACGFQKFKLLSFEDNLHYDHVFRLALDFPIKCPVMGVQGLLDQLMPVVDDIRASTVVRNVIDPIKAENEALKAELKELRKFKQHYDVEMSLRHDKELK